jgi:hypothetical protein
MPFSVCCKSGQLRSKRQIVKRRQQRKVEKLISSAAMRFNLRRQQQRNDAIGAHEITNSSVAPGT